MEVTPSTPVKQSNKGKLPSVKRQVIKQLNSVSVHLFNLFHLYSMKSTT